MSAIYRYRPHPGSPWVAEAVARVIAHERLGFRIDPVPLPETTEDRMAVIDAIAEHRVAVVLADHLDALGVHDVTAEVVRRMRHQLVTAGLGLELDTNMVSALLTSAGIEHLVVKGAALAAIQGLQPSQRGAGDVDLWVRPADLVRTEALLHQHGWSRYRATLPNPTDGWRWRLLMSVGNELPQRSDRANAVDIHWRLTQNSGEHIPDFDEAYARSVPAAPLVDGVRTLCPTDALNHLAQHGRKDAWPTLRHVVDLVRVADRCEPNDLRDMAERLPNVALALAVAELATGMRVEHWHPAPRTRRLADEAWHSCLSLRNPLAQRLQAGSPAARWQFEWWQIRSAPTWTSRMSWGCRLAIPLQRLVRPTSDGVGRRR